MEHSRDEFARYVSAQADVYEKAIGELSAGRKASHWMWFIFPQLRGLGHSEMSRKYAIASVKSAQRYLDHPLVGPRLRECTRLIIETQGNEIESIFGYVDAMKFHSCMTLFAIATEEGGVFSEALDRFFAGEQDPNTLRLLRKRHELL